MISRIGTDNTIHHKPISFLETFDGIVDLLTELSVDWDDT